MASAHYTKTKTNDDWRNKMHTFSNNCLCGLFVVYQAAAMQLKTVTVAVRFAALFKFMKTQIGPA